MSCLWTLCVIWGYFLKIISKKRCEDEFPSNVLQEDVLEHQRGLTYANSEQFMPFLLTVAIKYLTKSNHIALVLLSSYAFSRDQAENLFVFTLKKNVIMEFPEVQYDFNYTATVSFNLHETEQESIGHLSVFSSWQEGTL